MTTTERDSLFKDAFYYINSYKRHRSLYNQERAKHVPNQEILNYHELKQFQFMDNLELAMRGLQKDHRESAE